MSLTSSPCLPTRRRKRPAVSVCIANWNCREMLRACLHSLASKRQGVRVEVIVVDNASSDGAADMVEREFPQVTLIRNDTNAGFSRATNQAAARARGRFLFFLNNDTLVPRGALRRLCRYGVDNPNAGLIGPRLRGRDGRTQPSVRQVPTVAALLHRLTLLRWTGLFRSAYRRYRGNEERHETSRVEVLLGAALLMPRRLYREIGGWDESYTFGGEDIELCARVSRSRDVVYHPAVTVTHFGRVSTRQRAGWAGAQTLIGVTHSLRLTGTPSGQLTAYKTLVLLDVPFRAMELGVRYLWGRLSGRPRQATRAWLDLCGLAWLVGRGLGAFWRA